MKYFDYAATTPVNKDILNTYVKVTENYFAHSGVNPDIKRLETEAKNVILEKLGFNKSEFDLIFTSGGTEANNLAVKGYASTFESKRHFIVSVYEHSSMHESFEYLEECGHEVTYINPNQNGEIEVETLVNAIKDNTVMVSIMHVNNEIGSINDIKSLSQAVKAKNSNIVFLCDNVQGVGKTQKLDNTNLDLVSISAHKIYAPKGVGALIKRKKVNVIKQIHGGSLEDGMRGGTQNLANQVAFAKAVKDIMGNLDEVLKEIASKRKMLVDGLLKNEKIKLNVESASNVISIRIDMKMQSESVVTLMLNKGFAISTKSACSSKLNKGSRSLHAIGLTSSEQDHTFRISISHFSETNDIKALIKAFNEVIEENE